MRLSEIHAAIDAGQEPVFPEDRAFATLVAIEHLARIEGIPVSAVDFAAPRFGAKYSFKLTDLRGSWRGRAQYLARRKLILNAQMRFAPGDVDADPWKSLDRADRLWNKHEKSALHGLYKKVPADTHPRDVDDVLLNALHAKVKSEDKRYFRSSVANFRRLFRNDLALRTGLLPVACPGSLPASNNHRQHTHMSPQIEGWRTSLTDRNVIRSLDYLNRLAVIGGRLNGKTDTLDDLRLAVFDLPDPADVDVPPIVSGTLRLYVGRVRRALGGPDPRKTPAEQAWADLRAAARAAGCETGSLGAVAKASAARGIFPTMISEPTAREIVKAFEVHHARSKFRRGCDQLDALRGRVPPDLLPPYALGIKRPPPPPPRASKRDLPQDPVKNAWADLYARLRGHGWKNSKLKGLSCLRVRACAANIAPEDLRQEFIDTLERNIDIGAGADRTRLRTAVRSIAELSREGEFGNLPVLVPPAYTKFTHGGPGERAQAELELLMDFMNAAHSTRRGFRVAVGVLSDAMGRPDIPLRKLLHADISSYGIGHHEPRRKVHADKIRNLREFIELPWTPAWRKLQEVVVGTGITPLNNPVPKLLEWNPGTDPSRVTLDWAQRLDRHFRSTLNYPPHGRTYSSKKLARHLASFDALHDIHAVAQSGLLPPRIGPIR